MQSFYQTNNTMLATALASAGVPFAEENGRPIPSLCFYTTANLKSLGYKDVTLWDAAHDAWKRKRPGTVVYQFMRCELLERVKAAFDKTRETMAKDATARIGPEVPGLQLSSLEPEDFGRIVAWMAGNRSWLMDEWWKTPPLIALYGDPKFDGNTMTNSAKVISLNATDKTRAQIGI